MSDQPKKANAKAFVLEKNEHDQDHYDGELTDRTDDGRHAVFDEFQGTVRAADDLHLRGLQFFGGSWGCRHFAEVFGQRTKVAKSQVKRTGRPFLDSNPLGMDIIAVFW